jgi:hypothetical protein
MTEVVGGAIVAEGGNFQRRERGDLRRKKRRE